MYKCYVIVVCLLVRYVRGCLQSCNDADACNEAHQMQHIMPLLYIILHVLFYVS